MNYSLEKSVFLTMAYFDIFNIPLNSEEIKIFLYAKTATSKEVSTAIESLLKRNLIQLKNGFYFLAGRQNLINERIIKEKSSEKWISKAIKFIPLLKIAPFVRTILITGSTSMRNATEKSDIDLVLIVDKDYIYTAKTFLWIILKILGQYEIKNKKAGRFSIGYCYSTTYLTLSENAFMCPWPMRRYWVTLNMPIFDIGGYKKLLSENSWIKNELPNFSFKHRQTTLRNPRVDTKKSLAQKIIEKSLDNKIGKLIESALAKMHIEHTWRLPENYLSTSCTVATHNRLQLNAKEASKKIKERFDERIKLYT